LNSTSSIAIHEDGETDHENSKTPQIPGTICVLDAFRPELHDFPFAQACLDAGREVLAARS